MGDVRMNKALRDLQDLRTKLAALTEKLKQEPVIDEDDEDQYAYGWSAATAHIAELLEALVGTP